MLTVLYWWILGVGTDVTGIFNISYN